MRKALFGISYVLVCLAFIYSCQTMEMPKIPVKKIFSKTSAMFKKEKTPCWIMKDASICPEYEQYSGDYVYLLGNIQTEAPEIPPAEKEIIEAILSTLRGNYIERLYVKVEEVFKEETYCKEAQGKSTCERKIQEYLSAFSEGEIYGSEIQIIDWHYDKKEQMLYALGNTSKFQFEKNLQNIINNIKTDVKDRTIESKHPSESTKEEQSPVYTSLQLNCQDVVVDWIPFDSTDDKQAGAKQSLNLIGRLQNEIEKMYQSEKGGIYSDPRVLETNSEIYRNKETISFENIDKYEIKTQERVDQIIRCLEKKIADVNSGYFETKVNLLEELNRLKAKYAKFNNFKIEWENLIKQINQYQNEIQTLNKIYKERLKLLPHTYLVFTYANSRDLRLNKEASQEYFGYSAENRLKQDQAKHFISKQIEIKDNFANVVLEDRYRVEIQKAASDGISFKPKTGARANIEKYRIIESSRSERGSFEEKSGTELRDIPNAIAKCMDSLIITGIEDIEISFRTDKNRYNCDNCQELQDIYFWLEKKAKESLIDISKQKEKVQRAIKLAIDENFQMIEQYNILKTEYINKRQEKEARIRERMLLISGVRGLNEKINQLFGLEYSNITLPNNLSTNDIDRIVEEKLKPLEQKLLSQIDDVRTKLIDHDRSQEIIRFSVIDKTEEIKLETLKERIAEKFGHLVENCCTSIHAGKRVIQDNIEVHSSDEKYRFDPKLTAYAVPFFRIKSIHGTDSVHYTIGLSLKVNCQGSLEEFHFLESTKEIIDIGNQTRWKLRRKDQIPEIFNPETSLFERPNINEYYAFCTKYEHYMTTVRSSPTFQDWPCIECLPHFKFDPIEGILTDYVRNEQWKIINENTWSNVAGQIRPTDWQMQSYARIDMLFNEIRGAIIEGNIDSSAIAEFQNKYFWTNTPEGRQIEVIMFDGKNIVDDLRRKDEKCNGLVIRKENNK